ncbi:MAG: RNA-binding protein [Candidatus Korobacteraceae bacterium]
MQNIFVGNLAVDTSEHTLRAAFEAFGQVLTVKLVTDRDTGIPRGFAFIEMSSDAEAQAAIAGLKGHTIDGQLIDVNEARPKLKESKSSNPGMRRHREHRI